ncbi:hypothetical protein niasHT_031359 [Heterodera trifolii]|uniref:Uncharacterized protein n=1 Tax=Heterodera trifolii TaxID=157864 RepID=A0ABD2ISW1_9BILA
MAEENPKWKEAKEREAAAETMRRIYASQQRDRSPYISDRAKFEARQNVRQWRRSVSSPPIDGFVSSICLRLLNLASKLR